MHYNIENIDLVKSILEKQNQLKYNVNLILLTELDSILSTNNQQVYYYGSLTIGNETEKTVNVFLESKIQFKLDSNTKDYSLFNYLEAIQGDHLRTTLQGQFYGVLFTPTKEKNKPFSFY